MSMACPTSCLPALSSAVSMVGCRLCDFMVQVSHGFECLWTSTWGGRGVDVCGPGYFASTKARRGVDRASVDEQLLPEIALIEVQDGSKIGQLFAVQEKFYAVELLTERGNSAHATISRTFDTYLERHGSGMWPSCGAASAIAHDSASSG